MPRVLLIATTTGYQTRAFGQAATALGIELVFATDRCDQLDDPWRDAAVAVRFHDEVASLAAIAIFSGIALADNRSTSRALLMSQFWQKRQPKLHPAVPKDNTGVPG